MTAEGRLARRRVVVSGVGIHCAWGDFDQSWASAREGRSAVTMQSFSDLPGVPAAAAAPVAEASALEFLRDRKIGKYMSPASKLAVVAAGRALRDAGLIDDAEAKASLALYVTTGWIAFDLGAVSQAITQCRGADGALDMDRLGSDGLRSCPPLMPFKMLLNMSLGLVSIVFGIRGTNQVTYPGADQAGASLEAAVRGIARGRIDTALVGGTAQHLSLMPLVTLMKTGRLAGSVAAATPYHPEHAGLAPSDGAAFVVLETLDSARRAGRTPLAELGQVRVGRAMDGARTHFLYDLWRDACGEFTPSTVLTTGNATAEEDESDVRAVSGCFGAARPSLESYDGTAGWFGAGSFPFAVAMAAKRVQPAGSSPMLVSAHAGSGSHAAVLVSRLEDGA